MDIIDKVKYSHLVGGFHFYAGLLAAANCMAALLKVLVCLEHSAHATGYPRLNPLSNFGTLPSCFSISFCAYPCLHTAANMNATIDQVRLSVMLIAL